MINYIDYNNKTKWNSSKINVLMQLNCKRIWKAINIESVFFQLILKMILIQFIYIKHVLIFEDSVFLSKITNHMWNVYNTNYMWNVYNNIPTTASPGKRYNFKKYRALPNLTFHILGIFIIMNSNTSAPNVTVRDI